MVADGSLQWHWPVPMALHRFERAAEVNPVLAQAFCAMRATDAAARGAFYASADDLLRRVDLPEFRALIEFIAASLQTTAQQANAGMWPSGRHGLQLDFIGVWFQIQNGALNGATRFYSPMFPLLGGAYMDRGNAWLQNATFDLIPHEGELVVFPSFLPHKVLPYAGDRDRIIVSFNAQISAPGGDRLFQFTGM